MSSDVMTHGNPMEEFQKRVLEKLKTDIGSLMPEAALSKLVEKAVQETFFTPTKVRNPSYNRYGYGSDNVEYLDAPSWFQAEVKKTAAPLVEAAVAQHVEAHKAEILEAVRAQFDKDKLLIVTATIAGKAVGDGMLHVASDFIQQLKNQGLIRGY